MRILGIETSCDETSAAVVEETGDAARPGRSARTSSPRRSRSTASGAASCPSWRRGSTSATSAASSSARWPTRLDLERPRRDRRHAGARAGRIAARRRVVREGRRRRGRPAARRRPSSRRPHRVARAAERRAAAAGDRAGRLGRPHQPVSRRDGPASTSCSAARATMRRARRTTRSRSCWASAIRAGRSSIGWRAPATTAPFALPGTRLTHADRNAPHLKGDLDFSFSGLKTAVLRSCASGSEHGRAGRTGDRRHLRQLSARRRRRRWSIGAFEAARRHGAKSIGVAGGVSANSRLRAELT